MSIIYALYRRPTIVVFEMIKRWFFSFNDYKHSAFHNYDYQQFDELVKYHTAKQIVLWVLLIIVIVLIIITFIRMIRTKTDIKKNNGT